MQPRSARFRSFGLVVHARVHAGEGEFDSGEQIHGGPLME
jgi:hypothetical protein